MNTGDARIPNARDGVAHSFGCQGSFFSYGYVTCSRRHNRDWSNTAIGFVAPDPHEPGRFMPFRVGYDVANLAVGAFVSPGNEDVGRALRKAFDDAHDLRARLAAAKNDLRKSQARRARMIHAREADVFEVQVLDAFDGVAAVQIAALKRVQQFLELVLIHLCSGILTFDCVRSVPYYGLSVS